ncbi:MAG: hypothetical protein JXB62_05785 [Pirellulales bacterium]|nr:hypothetical protein [Pirellulales bacterium]
MSKSLPVQSDPAHGAAAAVGGQRGDESDASPLEVVTRPRRAVPPPPPGRTASPETASPEVDTGGPRPAGWRLWWAFVGRRLSSGCVVSFLFHFCLLLSLALFVEAARPTSAVRGLTAYANVPVPLEELGPRLSHILPVQPNLPEGGATTSDPTYRVPRVADLRVDSQRSGRVEPRPHGTGPPEPSDWLLRADTPVGGMLDGRDQRTVLAQAGGGTPQSEEAVERGLRWLKAHRREDGSWCFDLRKTSCRGLCRYSGSEASTTAATAMALLPFLGAGYTHMDGEYRDVVREGLYYLTRRALVTPHGYDLQEGTMYAQGLAAIALCEGYAMTRDPALKDFGQGAIDFVCYAQDVKGGGWRYTPGAPGDMTVTGWQLMALKSGQMAGMAVPPPTIYLVREFLSGVESDGGAQYGYMTPQPRSTTSAIGLLCRMYTGRERDHPGLQRGVALLAETGPSKSNMYFNYYATQALHHWQGQPWERWNAEMRDYLVATQAVASHEAGSWHFPDPHGDKGGRLYNTAMALMTLEVYYRYMPIYGQQAVEEGF